jgi:hypothetical protein
VTYKCLDPSTGRVYTTRDVIFDEQVFPFASLPPNAGRCFHAEIALHPTLFPDLNPGVLATNGHMDNFSHASDQNLSCSGVQLDPVDTKNPGALEPPTGISTQESVPIIGVQGSVSAPGALLHGPGSTSDPVPSSPSRNPTREAILGLAPTPGSSTTEGIHPTVLHRL